jgi:XXXCH domain-containing protein
VAAGQVAAKVKVKAEGPEAGDDGEESKDQYKKLKKRMKETYKKISETLDAGGLPDARTVRLFLTDSDEMIEWPDRGDEYYEPYRKACLLFREAFDAEDLEGCRTARGELEQVKKDCHAEYK